MELPKMPYNESMTRATRSNTKPEIKIVKIGANFENDKKTLERWIIVE